MKKLFCMVFVLSLLSTNALADDHEKAQKIYDELSKLFSSVSKQFVEAHNKRDMKTCYHLEDIYAPKVKELYESASILDSHYSYTFRAAGVMVQCLSCLDTEGSCKYAEENLQKASEELKKE